ncbi:MAG TPA: polysaccharide deacetylase family protein [Mycobacteriales bacterium]|nr:polysaccharide deacetylase family protein [Mycobacteriales bacterium]
MTGGPVPLVVSVHDVAPATAAETRQWCAALDRRGVPASLLVVPGPWRSPVLPRDPGLVRWLAGRVAGGDEIVLHGWAHRAGPAGSPVRRLVAAAVARGAAEFAALDEHAAHRRLVAGAGVLADLGLPAVGFTPPGWLQSAGTIRALRRLGFHYTTSHLGVHDLRSGGFRPAIALSHRPGAAGERLGAVLLPAGARLAAARGRPIRIALHPADLGRPGLQRVTLDAIDAALAGNARPCTYAALLARPAAPATVAG